MFDFLKRKYSFDAAVQFDGDKLVVCGDSIKWLERNLEFKAFTENSACDEAFEILHEKYPEYGDHIQLHRRE